MNRIPKPEWVCATEQAEAQADMDVQHPSPCALKTREVVTIRPLRGVGDV